MTILFIALLFHSKQRQVIIFIDESVEMRGRIVRVPPQLIIIRNILLLFLVSKLGDGLCQLLVGFFVSICKFSDMIIVMLGSTSFFDWVWLADVDTGLTSVTGSGSGLTSAGCLHTHFVANYFRSVKVYISQVLVPCLDPIIAKLSFQLCHDHNCH